MLSIFQVGMSSIGSMDSLEQASIITQVDAMETLAPIAELDTMPVTVDAPITEPPTGDAPLDEPVVAW